MALSDVDVVLWVQMGFFIAVSAVLLFLGWGVRTPAKRLKMLALGFGFVVMFISSTSMALEQGYKTRSDLTVINWERYVSLTIFLPFFVFMVALSLDEWWGKAATAFALQFIVSSLLIFGQLSTGNPIWVALIYSGATLLLLGLFMAIFLVPPEGSQVTNSWRWITVGITVLGLVVYEILYILSEGFTAISPTVFSAYNPVGAAIYLVVNALFAIWGLVVFRMIDLHEDTGGVGVGLPILSGGQKQCKNNMNGTPYTQVPQQQPQQQQRSTPPATRSVQNGLDI
jgi:hypothetical protein